MDKFLRRRDILLDRGCDLTHLDRISHSEQDCLYDTLQLFCSHFLLYSLPQSLVRCNDDIIKRMFLIYRYLSCRHQLQHRQEGDNDLYLGCLLFQEIPETSKLENYENLFGARLQQWVDDKKYLSSQLTIDSLASEMGTNKVYLSRYINGKHAVNFSTWITTLRIKEAQAYMLAHPGATLEEVAYHVGFSSASYFSRVFSRIVKTSPTIWRSNI